MSDVADFVPYRYFTPRETAALLGLDERDFRRDALRGLSVG